MNTHTAKQLITMREIKVPYSQAPVEVRASWLRASRWTKSLKLLLKPVPCWTRMDRHFRSLDSPVPASSICTMEVALPDALVCTTEAPLPDALLCTRERALLDAFACSRERSPLDTLACTTTRALLDALPCLPCTNEERAFEAFATLCFIARNMGDVHCVKADFLTVDLTCMRYMPCE